MVKKLLNPHSFSYAQGNCVNVNKEIIEGAFSTPVYEKIWINHYWTRSLEEWDAKVARGQADTGQKRDSKLFDDLNRSCTEHI
ncbi:MAG: hypothetical protein IMZ53_15230 [Thermoplasmata archaeon]|nr:hypothetical protein [Thermoplasmata archaeon]